MPSQKIADRIEYWKSQLLDLSRRNRLLYFRRMKSSTFFISAPEPGAVFDRLVKGKSWGIWVPPYAGENDGNLLEYDQPSIADLSEKRRENELVTDIEDRKVLERTLVNLFRRSNTDYQERGVRVLHIAAGLVNWRENDGGEVVQSPLLLIPVELHREDIQSPMEIRPTEEDIVVNPALQVKFASDFKIELPEPPDDWENGAIADYISRVRKRLKIHGWEVLDAAVVGIFSFHKLVIYRDLTANSKLVSEHSMVRALARDDDSDCGTCSMPSEREIDSIQNPKDTYQILDADSSQQACVQAMLGGGSFVMQGPPGTGKSQTIANMIAECIARGKSVLFVSEKMAALEVVYKRLVNASLQDFCLQLHSHNTNKKEVAQELSRCILHYPHTNHAMSSAEAERLLQARDHLNEYVKALHEPQTPSGWTAHKILGYLAETNHLPAFATGLTSVREMTQEQVDRQYVLVNKLRYSWRVALEGEDFPWLGYKNRKHGVRSVQELDQFLDDAIIRLQNLSTQIVSISAATGVPVPTLLPDADRLYTTLQLIDASPIPDRKWLLDSELGKLQDDAQKYCDAMQAYRTERDRLFARYGDPVF
ncbi:MAG: DUF4011 domain-containing protein, partial [Candidatus Marsarchaeota archaeon]|nr:DUF4011 domain-containing protein [Candidatus Marsarchaeota archaeon]